MLSAPEQMRCAAVVRPLHRASATAADAGAPPWNQELHRALLPRLRPCARGNFRGGAPPTRPCATTISLESRLGVTILHRRRTEGASRGGNAHAGPVSPRFLPLLRVVWLTGVSSAAAP